MKINKIIAAAMSAAIIGCTYPYIGCGSPESIITASAAEESVIAGVKITDSKNADIYNGDKSKSFTHIGRTYYSGIILSAPKDEKAFVEFDISDVKTFSCSARYLQAYYTRNDYDSVKVYVDDVLNEDWSFTKENNVSKNSKLRFEYSKADIDFVICDIVTDKGSSEAPVIPEYKSGLEFMKSGFLSQYAEIYTGEDKDKTFNVKGRKYSKGILLTAQADESMYAADKAARISFNVENVSKIKFKFARAVIGEDYGCDTRIRILNDYGRNMAAMVTDEKGETTKEDGLPVYEDLHIMECEIDVSKTDVITFVYNNRFDDAYAFMDISIDGMPAESEYTIPEYKNETDFLKSAFRTLFVDIYSGENKEKTFSADGKTYDSGIVFKASETTCNAGMINFNVENLDKISFTLRLTDTQKKSSDYVPPNNTLMELFIAGDKKSGIHYQFRDVDLNQPVTYKFDVSDMSILSIHPYFHPDDFDREFAITDIKLNPVDDENTSTSQTDNILYGDANCDGDISLADAILIMQSLANPNRFSINGDDKNKMTKNGLANADCCNTGDGITNLDALAIQKYTLNLISSLPENK